MNTGISRGLAAWLFALSFSLLAQNEADVLRYGWIDPLASARVTAMGGSFGALGADLSCMGINPAGLGMYRRGDLAMTAGVHTGSTNALWGTRQVEAAQADVVASNYGVALTYPSVDADWPFFTLAVGHQNRTPFAQKVEIDGVSTGNSVSDLFVSQALDDADVYGYPSTDAALDAGEIFGYGASLAWRTGLLVPDNDALYATAAEGNVTVDRTIERQGRLAETQIAFGTMFQDRVSIGATLGLPRVSFEESSTHREAVNAAAADLQDWAYEESLSVSGKGVLLRFGVLARVSDILRVGVAHQTRGRLTLTDTYATSIQTSWIDEPTGECGQSHFQLRIPPVHARPHDSQCERADGQVGCLERRLRAQRHASGRTPGFGRMVVDGVRFWRGKRRGPSGIPHGSPSPCRPGTAPRGRKAIPASQRGRHVHVSLCRRCRGV